MVPAFVITADHEISREALLAALEEQLPGVERVSAVYPSRIRVPFLERLKQTSLARTGYALRDGEIGVLLSNRKIWRRIVNSPGSDDQMYLILESDSILLDSDWLYQHYQPVVRDFDLFFWGAWSGHMQLHRSSTRKYAGHVIGDAFIRSVYGAYGYCLNKKTAALLLKRTSKISYPVDQYKRFIKPGELRIGGIKPELITHGVGESMIGHPGVDAFRRKLWMGVLDVRNAIICFFS
jgi:GR25 family glycosyltransferase involved in LPS biosynthesis